MSSPKQTGVWVSNPEPLGLSTLVNKDVSGVRVVEEICISRSRNIEILELSPPQTPTKRQKSGSLQFRKIRPSGSLGLRF